ncbi:MAG: protein kinase [Lentisphaeria bacterium]|nr:protein kinase [Lentisphaeria bacterium]NQZ70942.1 protein kinase [Lentisphaeria bacterium]
MTTILCADDEQDMQLLYKELFSENGFNIKIASDGKSALSNFADTPADLIILDYEMPGLNGIDTCQKFRELANCVERPIFMVSAFFDEELMLKAYSNGCDECISKPFEPEEFIAKIKFTLKKHEAKREFYKNHQNIYERFNIQRVLGQGGSSTVYFASDSTKKMDVALKVYQSQTEIQEDLHRSLLLREAYEWSKLNHPNIVQLFDFGNFRDGFYLSLEFIDGESLEDLLEKGLMEEEFVYLIGQEILETLVYMKSMGIVHRDIKPANILISNDGEVKLTDFGLAKQQMDSELTMQANIFRGTPHYVSPEQIKGIATTEQSDIYSLGATLYHAATGLRPFDGDTVAQVLEKNLRTTVPMVHEVNAEISEELSLIIDKMMQKKMPDRYTLEEVYNDWFKIADI